MSQWQRVEMGSSGDQGVVKTPACRLPELKVRSGEDNEGKAIKARTQFLGDTEDQVEVKG